MSFATQPKISVVMPVHNARRFLDEAIRSIITQTFADFELVILDDSSTDGSLEVSREWAKRDDRISLFENKDRLGHSATSNLAVSRARADYVARMDADDISHPERLFREWKVLSQSAGIVLAGTLADGIDADGKQVRPRDRWRIVRRSKFAPFAHGSIMFRKRTFAAVSGYAGTPMRVGDQDLYHRMAQHGHIVTLPEVLYHYRYHLDNSTLQKVPAAKENGAPNDALYVEGAMRLWAGHTPDIQDAYPWKSGGVKAAVLARWGNASPSSLRTVMRCGVSVRDRVAGIWIKDGKTYDWRREG